VLFVSVDVVQVDLIGRPTETANVLTFRGALL
jgi:hypothetical protein